MIAWNPAFVGEHESAWSLLHTMAWLNECSPDAVIGRAGGLPLPPLDSGALGCTFVDTAWLHPEVTQGQALGALRGAPMRFDALPRALAQRGGNAFCGALAPALVAERVRYCRYCLSIGFHALAHQLRGLARCPRHNHPLEDRCPYCNAPMPVFGLGVTQAAFQCTYCHQSWLEHDPYPIPACEQIRRDRTIGRVHRWCEALARLPYDWSVWTSHALADVPFPLDHRLGYRVTMDDVTLRLLHDVVKFPKQAWLGPRPRGLYATLGVESAAPITGNAPEATLTLRQLARRVDRFIRREWLKGHRVCVDYATRFLPRSTALGFAEAVHGLCPLAHGYGLWRLRMGPILAPVHGTTPDQHPVAARDRDALCGAWLSMFHYAVACSRQTVRRGNPPRAVWRSPDPYLELHADPWQTGIAYLPPLRGRAQREAFVIHFRTDLSQPDLKCTLPRWPSGKPELAHRKA